MKTKKKYHFTGVAGTGMSALAAILKQRGREITGSDEANDFQTATSLRNAGIQVKRFNPANITKNLDLVVYSSAYNPATHPELKKAAKIGIPIQSYAEALAALFNSYERRVLVTGTHGKSTTTAMIGHILTEAGHDPTVIVGAEVKNWKSNSRTGKSNIMVVEGDEYQEKVLLMNPTLLVLTATDYDHPDYFKNQTAYESMFDTLVRRMPKNKNNVVSWKKFAQAFRNHPAVSMPYLMGKHNQQNAHCALRAVRLLGLKETAVKKALKTFKGVGRRLEFHRKPEAPVVLLDDYAHHPTEIKASLNAVRERYPKQRIIVIFQPHTFSRTKAFLDDFAQSFSDADAVIVLKTFSSARERTGPIGAKELAQAAAKHHPSVRYAATHKKAIALAKDLVRKSRQTRREQAVLITMGAGDVNHLLGLL